MFSVQTVNPEKLLKQIRSSCHIHALTFAIYF